MRQFERHRIVELREVSKVYHLGQHIVKAIDSVTLDICERDFITIRGPSGSGKTTLLNVIGCLTKPTTGMVLVNGVDTTKMSDVERSRLRGKTMGFIFQGYNLIPTLTALENVLISTLFIRARVADADVEKATKLLTQLGLKERTSHHSGLLSYGEQQRVAIARALMNDPEILLADEPTGTLDTHNAEEVVNIIEQLNAAGKTVILVTHDPKVGSAGETRYELRDGRLSPAK
jgi:putative ABC transport system ATP-binding protein